MKPSTGRALWWGLALGIILSLGVLAGLYQAGYRLMRHTAPPAGPVDKKAICWVSPKNPDFIQDKPGKDPEGNDLIPVYASQAPGQAPAPSAAPTGAAPKEGRKIKYWVSSMDPKQVSDKPGKDSMGMDLVPVYEEAAPAPPAAKKERKVKYWVDPMDPRNVSDRPGKAPCGMDMVPVYETGGEEAAPGTIAVDPNTLQSMGVRTAKVEVKDLSRTIRAVARVTYDERRLTVVNTKVNGWVDRLFARVTGDPIRKGQPLLSIYSPELVSTQQEYLLALKNLKSVGQSPFPELGESAQRLLAATKRRLEYWDISPGQIEALAKTGQVKKDLTLTSPVNGIVMKRMVTQGQMVQAGMPLLEVVDLSEVWVEADLYEYELPWVQVGQPAQMTLSYLPGETLHGKVLYIYPYLSGATRTAKVRLAFPNPGLKLKPDMFAQVAIKSPLPQAVVAVPSEAVLDSGERQLVFLALGQGRFEPRQVKLGVEGDDGWRQVTEGLNGGEEVVTSAQFLLDSESRIREAIAKMLKTPSQTGPAAPAPGKEAAPSPEKKAPPAPVHKH
ncbi:MAG: efflux RND transporter periplasmic adaptor subunit [Desulfobaccales bacterium]|nr:efflux RND transporter periplasmic adaptor subunit [Desulfobaccales bacterium]